MSICPASAEKFGSDLLHWMDPLAGDVIAAAYVTLVRDKVQRIAIVRCHSLLWRGLLAARPDAPTFRRELSRLAAPAGISESAIDTVNKQVLAELLDTVAARYSRSPREAGRLSYQVTLIACWLWQLSSAPGLHGEAATGRQSSVVPSRDAREQQRELARELALAKRRA